MKKLFLYLTSFLAVSCLIILFYFSPIFIAPPPLTGPYVVGRMDIMCQDSSRQEPHVQHPEPRKLLVRFYYPTQSSNVQQTFSYPNLSTIIDKATQHLPLPGWVTRQLLKDLSCRAEPNATPSSDKKFPVILFSHGIGGMTMETTYQEELASHGYIIACVFHPYSIEFVAYPDGTVVSLDPAFRKAIEKTDRDAIYAYRAKAHHLWIEDLNFVTNYLMTLAQNQQSPFFNKLDTNNIGIFGASHGGGVAIDFCKTNKHCKVGINMDGWTKTANSNEGFEKPFLFLMSKDNEGYVSQLHENMKGFSEKIVIDGAGHSAFGDHILLKQPLPWLLGITTKNPLETKRTIANYIKTFFDKHLKRK